MIKFSLNYNLKTNYQKAVISVLTRNRGDLRGALMFSVIDSTTLHCVSI